MSTRFSRPPGTVIRIHGNRSSFTPVIVDTTDHTRSAWEAEAQLEIKVGHAHRDQWTAPPGQRTRIAVTG